MKNTTEEEFLEKGYLVLNENPEYSEFNINSYHDFFGKEVNIRIQGINSKEESDKITIAFQAVKNLLSSEIVITENIKKEVYQDYRDTIENAVLGMVDYEGFEDEIEANEAHFKISSPTEAFSKIEFNSIWTDLDIAKNDVFNFYYQSPWNKGTGSYETIQIIIKNGESIGLEVW